MSFPSGPKPYSLQIAERIHNTTGKEHLTRICVGGFALESFWHWNVERRLLNTPAPAVRKAMIRAAVTWPALYVVTSAAVYWAAWKVDGVNRAEKEKGKENSQADF
ncbi:hypothetical protein SAMD00023353_0500210 [Rosellinia necatrix]|uniref:Uncharacterized protein n=1 Tax=Rosellinia necatrix TaxID=77044 RepID=A0A1S7UK40_ROSNE|nr:hypothetical protein SAMD00023353_0500210 [Rosellinia necatrix]